MVTTQPGVQSGMARTSQSSSLPIVFHVIDSLDISGGAERQLVANVRAFDHRQLDHRVVVIKASPTNRTEDLDGVVPVTMLFGDAEARPRVAVIARLTNLIRRQRPSLLHASLADASLASRVAGRLTRVPVVESLVNISHEPVRTIDNPHVTMAKLKAHALLDRLTMRHLAGFHAVSQAVADSWVRTVGLSADVIRVIPRGIQVTDMDVPPVGRQHNRFSVREEFGFPPDSFVVSTVGRVEPQKGHRYLIEATAGLVRLYPHIRVLIVGRSGVSSPSVEAMIRALGLAEHVHLVGPRRDISRILTGSDVFAFPSLFEGNGGNAMIEAMAAGLPIVTTNEPPMTDLIPDQSVGLLVPRAASGDLAEAISHLVRDGQLRASLGDAAKQRVRGFPKPEEIASLFEGWYRGLLDV